MQGKIYKKLDKRCNIWLEQNLAPRKTSGIMSTIEQMSETRAWKKVRRLTKNSQCRFCKEQRETVQHLLAECKMLASNEFLASHKRALMVMVVAWAKEQNGIRMCNGIKKSGRGNMFERTLKHSWYGTLSSIYGRQQHLESQIWCLKKSTRKSSGYVIWHACKRTI